MQPSREKLLDPGEWASLASRVPSLSFSKQRESAPFCGGSSPSFLLSCFYILRLSPLTFFLYQNALSGRSLESAFIAVWRFVTLFLGIWVSALLLNGKSRPHHGRGSRVAPSRQDQQVSKQCWNCRKAASFSGIALHVGSNVPPLLRGSAGGGGCLSCICVLLQAGHWGQRLDQDSNLPGAEGSSGAHGKWVVSGIQTVFAASAVCLWRG